ncbi:hypothetical protein SCHPADRAFT_940261 [Schizopora paradoxa]|uniref:DUF1690-domain-containing protein n=1 Tax=Schizopora paradoxa TaxID=27342 RepID=A0A0H2RNQ2_9AGAM|nr:hypothetical protein SCHPADRAFT_940261 [Schizopora paradoxa]
MGASQSSQRAEDDSAVGSTPIQFSRDVVNEMTDSMVAAHPSSSSLDDRIRAQIKSEIQRLHDTEEEVQKEIAIALAKENDDGVHSRAAAATATPEQDGDETVEEEKEEATSHALNSILLSGDIEEVRQKVDKFAERKSVVDAQTSDAAGSLLSCYKKNSSRPLDCWKEVETFRTLVADTERRAISGGAWTS